MTLDHPPLTHDERKAAEAAFQGRPINPMWPQKAQHIYDGIRAAQATSIEQLLRVFRRLAHGRSFTIQMVDVASLPLPADGLSSYSHDARCIDQDGFLA